MLFPHAFGGRGVGRVAGVWNDARVVFPCHLLPALHGADAGRGPLRPLPSEPVRGAPGARPRDPSRPGGLGVSARSIAGEPRRRRPAGRLLVVRFPRSVRPAAVRPRRPPGGADPRPARYRPQRLSVFGVADAATARRGRRERLGAGAGGRSPICDRERSDRLWTATVPRRHHLVADAPLSHGAAHPRLRERTTRPPAASSRSTACVI